MRPAKPASILLILLVLSGCSALKAAVAMTRSSGHFIPWPEHSMIHYEPGAEALAHLVQPQVDAAIQTIAHRQGRFQRPVIIYLPRSVASFADYCASPRPSACVIGYRLFLSPRLLQEPARIGGILTHELSHLQLTQALGRWNYQTKLPAWFKEGLAVFMSTGAGAEKVSEEQALTAIKQGKALAPNGHGHLLFMRTAAWFGLSPHLFYRQAALYVTWLHQYDPQRFQSLLLRLQDGLTLDQAMRSNFGFGVQAGWQRFMAANGIG